jgi:surfactin synthase thioesterase subunit
MTQPPARSRWVQVSRARPGARLRLVCLPPAGGGASRYRGWPALLPDDVEVVSVQLPGRENRFNEQPIESMEELVDQLVEGLASYLTRPFALFGHSMGALIAFELIRRLRPSGVAPVHLFASGCRAPHLPSRSPDWHTLPGAVSRRHAAHLTQRLHPGRDICLQPTTPAELPRVGFRRPAG